jgi:hypothetical protein
MGSSPEESKQGIYFRAQFGFAQLGGKAKSHNNNKNKNNKNKNNNKNNKNAKVLAVDPQRGTCGPARKLCVAGYVGVRHVRPRVVIVPANPCVFRARDLTFSILLLPLEC